MIDAINETHDPRRTSWVRSAQQPGSDFPIQNLPFGVFRRRGTQEAARVGVAIGDQVLDLKACLSAGLLNGPGAEACAATALNPLMALGREHWSALRRQISGLLSSDSPAYQRDPEAVAGLLVGMDQTDLLLPVSIGDYTDFYASIHHATNVGSMFRPDNPLLPNYKYVPIGYHGRASSVVVSGSALRRPAGQTKAPEAAEPAFGPSRLLDYELEVGCFIGGGNPLGEPIPLRRAGEQIFGLCLVNDWSARDIQAWEYQPLGPFLSKSFATSISPWVVTMEALAPFQCPAYQRPASDPQPLPHLFDQQDQQQGGIDLTLEVYLISTEMRRRGMEPQRLSQSSFATMYWTLAQMVTHHSSNGCNLRPGDLLASGTVSGPEKGMRGCLLELTWRGAEPLELPSGEQRRFLEDGDEVILRGYCRREGFTGIGFGECRGMVLPAAG